MDDALSGSPMKDNSSLALIDRICAVFEAANSEDAELAAEVMRVIRAVAVSGRVTLLAGGPAAELLQAQMPDEALLWVVVSVEDDSVPASAH
jgi:hypothetical protein